MRKLCLAAATAAALITTPLMVQPASASGCVQDTVADYLSSFGPGGGSCSVGNVSFSNFVVSVTPGGSITPGQFIPVTSGNESGLTMSFSVTSIPSDLLWTYNVTGINGFLITDALVAANLTPQTGPGAFGTPTVSETLSNNSPFFAQICVNIANCPSSTLIQPPQSGLFASKDTALGLLTTSASSITNEFSTSGVPIPGALPLFGTGLVALWGVRRKVRKQSSAPVAA